MPAATGTSERQTGSQLINLEHTPVTETLTINGNPGATIRTAEDDWQPGNADLLLERFIFDPQSATEAQLTLTVDTHDYANHDVIQTSAELTYADLVALRDHCNALIQMVIGDGRVPGAGCRGCGAQTGHFDGCPA